MNNGRKDTYELLSMSDSDSDTPQHIPELNFKSPRRKRLRKKLPAYRVKRYDESPVQQCCHSYGKHLSLSFIIVILCTWLLILSWLVVIFNDELKRFDDSLMQFTSTNMPESLQKCHQETKELQLNQSDLYSNFVKLNSKLTNLSSEISAISRDWSTVRNKLNISVGSDVPINVKGVLENINMLKSWIKELNDSVAQLQISESHLQGSNLTNPRENLSEKVPTNNTLDLRQFNDSKFMLLVSKLTENITYINNSLISEIQLIKEEHLRDQETLNNLSSFTYHNVSDRLTHFEAELKKLNFASNSSIKDSGSNTTSSTATEVPELPKVNWSSGVKKRP